MSVTSSALLLPSTYINFNFTDTTTGLYKWKFVNDNPIVERNI